MMNQGGNVVRLNRVTVDDCNQESTAHALSISRNGARKRDEYG